MLHENEAGLPEGLPGGPDRKDFANHEELSHTQKSRAKETVRLLNACHTGEAETGGSPGLTDRPKLAYSDGRPVKLPVSCGKVGNH